MSENEQLDEMGQSARALMSLGQMILALPPEQAETLKPTLAQLIAAIQQEFGQLIAERALAQAQRDEALDQIVELWHAHSALSGQALHEWLGWTAEQYKTWVESSDVPAPAAAQEGEHGG